MPTKILIFGMVTFLHDLFTAVWIGGLITLGLSVMPSVKKILGKEPATKQVMAAIQKRHSVLIYVSILGLVLTGLLKANQSSEFLGLFSFGNTFSAVMAGKHILVLAMILVSLYRSLVLGKTTTSGQEQLKGKLLILNIILGILVLLLSGFATALSSAVPLI